MYKHLAEALGLVAHGNAYLVEPIHRPIELPGELSRKTQYVSPRRAQNQAVLDATQIVATCTSEWLQYLGDHGALRLWALSLHSSQLLPLSEGQPETGEGTRGVQVDFADYTELWVPLTPNSGTASTSTYAGWRLSQSLAQAPKPLSVLNRSLHAAVEAALRLTEWRELTQWTPYFERSLNVLNDPNPHPQLPWLPAEGFSGDAHRLFGAARAAWVFGGMGWWNDNQFYESHRHDQFSRVTEELHAAVNAALYGAVHTPEKPASGPSLKRG